MCYADGELGEGRGGGEGGGEVEALEAMMRESGAADDDPMARQL